MEENERKRKRRRKKVRMKKGTNEIEINKNLFLFCIDERKKGNLIFVFDRRRKKGEEHISTPLLKHCISQLDPHQPPLICGENILHEDE